MRIESLAGVRQLILDMRYPRQSIDMCELMKDDMPKFVFATL